MTQDYLLRAALQPISQPEPREQLRQCGAAHHVDASHVHQHVCPGDLDPSDFTCVPSLLHRLQQQLADEAAQWMVETWAAWVPSTAPAWVYDVTRLDEDFLERSDDPATDLQALAQAVRYLDLRDLVHRPVAAQPQFVTFRKPA